MKKLPTICERISQHQTDVPAASTDFEAMFNRMSYLSGSWLPNSTPSMHPEYMRQIEGRIAKYLATASHK